MATLNVYLPDALKADMDTTEGINWSHVAQEAFRGAIVRNRPTGDKMESVIERLRATSGKNSVAYKEGCEAGRAWAMNTADADDLEALENVDLAHLLRLANGDIDRVADEILPFADRRPELLLKWTPPTRSRLQGFIDGALSVWSEVKDKL